MEMDEYAYVFVYFIGYPDWWPPQKGVEGKWMD
jgi:hypothetical protein